MITKALTGAYAAAEAMRQINPEVVGAYPITPQTDIMQKFSQFVADGIVDTELVRVESEHSAMSVVVGASAAGARAMTATSSVGLALMFEVLGVASGTRLPIVMNVVNRALSGPINIHCDHSDSMACRDAGWIQIYSENAKEVYENTLLAVRLAEHPDVLLPIMVCQDGFITSHGVENVDILEDEKVKGFIGKYNPKDYLLDTDKPFTIGPLQLQDYFFETKRQQHPAMMNAKKVFLMVGNELSKLTKKKYNYFEDYCVEDADVVIVTLNSSAGTVKSVVDKLRREGKKVGLLKIRLFRPFPYEEVREVLKDVKVMAVFDRSESFGAYAPLYGEIRNSLFELKEKPNMMSCIYGLGGRDLFDYEIEDVFEKLLSGKCEHKMYVGCR